MSKTDEMNIEDVKLKSYLDYTSQGKISRMTEDQTEVMMRLLTAEMQGIPLGDEMIEDDRGSQIIKLRLKNTDVECSTSCILFCSYLCDTPGKAVMWAYTLFKLYEYWKEEVTLSKLAESFPWGFPTDDSQRECWDSQKGYKLGIKDVDNALDRPESWGLKTW